MDSIVKYIRNRNPANGEYMIENDILESIKKYLSGGTIKLKVDDLTLESNFDDLNLSDHDIIELMGELENDFDFDFPGYNLSMVTGSVKSLVDWILDEVKRKGGSNGNI